MKTTLIYTLASSLFALISKFYSI